MEHLLTCKVYDQQRWETLQNLNPITALDKCPGEILTFLKKIGRLTAPTSDGSSKKREEERRVRAAYKLPSGVEFLKYQCKAKDNFLLSKTFHHEYHKD